MSARGVIEHTVDISAPLDAVAEFLADLTNYEAIHPLLVNVQKVPTHISAPRPLMPIVLRDGGRSHRQMWDNLRRRFEE